MMFDVDALAALNIFSSCCTKFQLQRVEHLGFSGSTLWKVISPEPLQPGPLCLKCWPADHPPPARLPWIHRVLLHAARNGIGFLPLPQVTQSGQTTCEYAGCTWELMTWLPGSADYPQRPTLRRLIAASRALAQFHHATADVGALDQTGSAEMVPAFADRIERWQQLLGGRQKQIQQAVNQRRVPSIDDLAQQWLAKYYTLSPDLLTQLSAAARLPLRLQPAIRDLWHDHVLFQDDEVTGFIDFGAMRMDTPLTDLARLIGSLAGDDQQQRVAAIAAYSDVRPLTAKDSELIDLLDHSGTLIAGWNWLEWLYVEERQFPSLPAVRERLSQLLSRRFTLPLTTE